MKFCFAWKKGLGVLDRRGACGPGAGRGGGHRGFVAGHLLGWMELPVLKLVLAAVDAAVLGLVRGRHALGSSMMRAWQV